MDGADGLLGCELLREGGVPELIEGGELQEGGGDGLTREEGLLEEFEGLAGDDVREGGDVEKEDGRVEGLPEVEEVAEEQLEERRLAEVELEDGLLEVVGVAEDIGGVAYDEQLLRSRRGGRSGVKGGAEGGGDVLEDLGELGELEQLVVGGGELEEAADEVFELGGDLAKCLDGLAELGGAGLHLVGEGRRALGGLEGEEVPPGDVDAVLLCR